VKKAFTAACPSALLYKLISSNTVISISSSKKSAKAAASPSLIALAIFPKLAGPNIMAGVKSIKKIIDFIIIVFVSVLGIPRTKFKH